MDMFCIQIAVQPFRAEFAGIAAHLHPAERSGKIICEGIIDPDGTGARLLKEGLDQAGVI